MISETINLVTAYLADNIDLPVYSELSSTDIALGRLPEELPLLAVTLDGPVVMSGETPHLHRDASITLMIRHVERITDTHNTTTYAVLHDVARQLNLFMGNSNSHLRQQDDVYILSLETVTHLPLMSSLEDNIIVGNLQATFLVRDVYHLNLPD